MPKLRWKQQAISKEKKTVSRKFYFAERFLSTQGKPTWVNRKLPSITLIKYLSAMNMLNQKKQDYSFKNSFWNIMGHL